MKFFRVATFGLLIAVFFSIAIRAEVYAAPNSATEAKFDFAKQCEVGDHVFILEKITLADVIRTLKSGVIQEGDRDDADQEWVVDYTDGSRLIRFSSFGDMGGKDHQLEGIEISQLSPEQKTKQLPLLRLPVTFQFGSIEMQKSNLVSALGPALNILGVAWYKYSGKRMIKVSSGKLLEYDVLSTLRVKIVDEKVEAIQLTRVSSS